MCMFRGVILRHKNSNILLFLHVQIECILIFIIAKKILFQEFHNIYKQRKKTKNRSTPIYIVKFKIKINGKSILKGCYCYTHCVAQQHKNNIKYNIYS